MVSVIIPAYNVERYIGKCIDSVVKQSYKDLEIIIVDDGSSDGTRDIICSSAKADKRITPIYKENGGASSARNIGLEHATGEYVYFIDADDVLEPDGIATLVSAMEDRFITASDKVMEDNSISGRKIDFVSCQYSRWDDTGKRLDDYDFFTGIKEFNSDEDRLRFILFEILPYHIGFEVWDKLYRLGILRQNSISFSENCSIGEDLSFNLKYLMYSDSINCISDRCVKYTIRSGSLMRNAKELSMKISENLILLEDFYGFISDRNNEYFKDKFVMIFAKLMDNSYLEETPVEVLDAYENISEKTFAIEQYSGFKEHCNDILALYSEDIAKIKYRYHLYVKAGLNGFGICDRIYFGVYNLYRHLRGRNSLEEWRMPY